MAAFTREKWRPGRPARARRVAAARCVVTAEERAPPAKIKVIIIIINIIILSGEPSRQSLAAAKCRRHRIKNTEQSRKLPKNASAQQSHHLNRSPRNRQRKAQHNIGEREGGEAAAVGRRGRGGQWGGSRAQEGYNEKDGEQETRR